MHTVCDCISYLPRWWGEDWRRSSTLRACTWESGTCWSNRHWTTSLCLRPTVSSLKAFPLMHARMSCQLVAVFAFCIHFNQIDQPEHQRGSNCRSHMPVALSYSYMKHGCWSPYITRINTKLADILEVLILSSSVDKMNWHKDHIILCTPIHIDTRGLVHIFVLCFVAAIRKSEEPKIWNMYSIFTVPPRIIYQTSALVRLSYHTYYSLHLSVWQYHFLRLISLDLNEHPQMYLPPVSNPESLVLQNESLYSPNSYAIANSGNQVDLGHIEYYSSYTTNAVLSCCVFVTGCWISASAAGAHVFLLHYYRQTSQ